MSTAGDALTAIGLITGLLVMASFAARLPERVWMALGIGGIGLGGTFYAFSGTVPTAVASFTLLGFFNAPAIIAIRLLFQRKTPARLIGGLADTLGVAAAVLHGLGRTGEDGETVAPENETGLSPTESVLTE